MLLQQGDVVLSRQLHHLIMISFFRWSADKAEMLTDLASLMCSRQTLLTGEGVQLDSVGETLVLLYLVPSSSVRSVVTVAIKFLLLSLAFSITFVQSNAYSSLLLLIFVISKYLYVHKKFQVKLKSIFKEL